MVRIVPGESWKLNPTYRDALQRAGGGRARFPSVLDALGIEVDGVNLSRGLSEASLFESVDELSALTVKLCRDQHGAGQLSLGGAELVLGRRGSRVSLSLVTLARPARLLAGEVEVELGALALAVADCAQSLFEDLDGINPALARSPLARRLSQRAQSLRKLARQAGKSPSAHGPAAPLAPEPKRAPAPSAPALALSLFDEEDRVSAYRKGADLYSLLVPGRVELAFADGSRVALGGAPPFLVLTDLARAAADLGRAAEAQDERWESGQGFGPMRVDLRGGTLALSGRELPCRPLELARALLEGALDFCGAIVARNPAQARNPYLAALEEGAREKLAQLGEVEAGNVFAEKPASPPAREPRPAPESPLAPGALKRLRFRPAWQGAELGERATSARVTRSSLIIAGKSRSCWIDPATGARQAMVRAEHVELYSGGALATIGRKLVGYTEQGAPQFLRDLGDRGHPRLSACAGALSSVGGDAILCAFDGRMVAAIARPTGFMRWQFNAPQAVRVGIAVAGDRAYAAADNGSLYGLEAADGQLAFRVRAGMAFEGALAVGGGMVCAVGRREGALWLLAVDLLSGRPLLTRPLPLSSAGTPVVWRKRIIVPGVIEGEPAVVGLTPSGREIFLARVEKAAGTPAISISGARLLLGLRDGGVVCLDGRGRHLWRAGPLGLELDWALPPILRRDVVVAAGDPIRALDPATGATLGELPPTQGLSAMTVGGDLDVYAVDEDGFASRFSLATHLSVVG